MNLLKNHAWDTDFFGYPVASASFDAVPSSLQEIRDVCAEAQQQNQRLVYIFTPPVEPTLRDAMALEGIISMGCKVDFSKLILENSFHSTAESDISPCRELTPPLEQLTLQSGSHSRFRLDHQFRNQEFERLYRMWISHSLSEESGHAVFVAGTAHEPQGLITLEFSQMARIGLLVVGPLYQRRGWGQRLIARAEQACLQAQQNTLWVATQSHNLEACNLYEKCGFQRKTTVEIFHLWMNPNLSKTEVQPPVPMP